MFFISNERSRVGRQLLHQILLIIVTLLICGAVFAQQKTITGYVKDKTTDEPIPFANVSIKRTTIGIATDWSGYFSIDASRDDTISISAIGYNPQTIIINSQTPSSNTIILEQNYFSLDEVNVKPDKDFSKEVLKLIQKHKRENHKKVLSTHEYKNFAKTTIYIALDSVSRTGQYFNNMGNVTTKIEDEDLVYTPIYVSQEASTFTKNVPTLLYNNKQAIFPKLNETVESIMSEYLLVQLDFYEDQIYIFDKGFVSPLNNTASIYYHISFTDSISIENEMVYNFSFYPRNKYAPLFTGEFSINKTDYSLRQMNVYFKQETNINFITGFKTTVAYKRQDDGKMFFSYQDIKTNLSFTPQRKKKDVYASDRVNDVRGGNWLLNKTTVYSTSEELENISANQWSNQQDFKSKNFDLKDYNRIETIQKQPLVRTLDAVSGILLTGYLNMGYFDVGSFFDMYRTNAVEGNRFTLPVRTSEKLFKYVTIGGFVGYGTKNKELKYGGNIAWQPFKKDKYIVRLGYTDDYLLVSSDKFINFIKNNANTQGTGDLVTAITTTYRNPYIKEEKTAKLMLEYNADKNVAIRVAPYYSYNKSTPDIRFVHNNIDYEYYNNTGTIINFRFAPGQKYDKLYFDRIYYFTNKPVLNIGTDIGTISLPNYESNKAMFYTHLRASIQGDLHFGNIIIHYMLNGGYIMGDAPYDYLDLPAGSLSLGYNKYRYCLLHQAAFAHNLYSNTYLDLNGGGFILSRIPVIKQLKWRERVSFKCHYGTLTDAYTGVFDLPDVYQHNMTLPYMELGVGLTNIFKFLHVEYFQQIGTYYKDDTLADRGGIRINAELRF